MAEVSPEDPLDRFRDRYRLSSQSVLEDVEREVIGVVFGANGYTTKSQAAKLADKLELGPGDLLLDVGGGRGWPSLYMAEHTGCDVVVTDPVMEGLTTISGGSKASLCIGSVASSGQSAPFRRLSFEAVVHSDVLC